MRTILRQAGPELGSHSFAVRVPVRPCPLPSSSSSNPPLQSLTDWQCRRVAVRACPPPPLPPGPRLGMRATCVQMKLRSVL